MYQDIIKYSIDGKYKEDDGKSFRLWNLTKWLLEVNQEFINYFRDPSTRNYTTANRIDDRIPRIKGKVEDLINLSLIVQIGTAKESKGTGTVPIFQFTPVGHIIAWVLESMNIERRDYAINQLYELFQDNFKDQASCTDMFCSIYYRKIKEHGLFGEFVDRFRERLESDKPIMNRQGFFQRLLILPMYNIESKSVDFYKLWRDSTAELDPETRMRFYYHIKLDFERKAEEECHAFREFEKVRFEAKDIIQSVVVEGQCKVCGYYTCAAFDLDGYMEMLHRGYPNGVITTKCNNCNKSDTCEYPILI